MGDHYTVCPMLHAFQWPHTRPNLAYIPEIKAKLLPTYLYAYLKWNEKKISARPSVVMVSLHKQQQKKYSKNHIKLEQSKKIN